MDYDNTSDPFYLVQVDSLRIGAEDATVISAAAASGQPAGLLQLTVRVPDGLSSGDAVPAVLTVGFASSQPGVTIAVK